MTPDLDKPTTPIRWKEVTERRYDEMIGAVPPLDWGGDRFLVGEQSSIRTCRRLDLVCGTYRAFVHFEGRFFEATEALTRAEFRQISGKDALAHLEVSA